MFPKLFTWLELHTILNGKPILKELWKIHKIFSLPNIFPSTKRLLISKELINEKCICIVRSHIPCKILIICRRRNPSVVAAALILIKIPLSIRCKQQKSVTNILHLELNKSSQNVTAQPCWYCSLFNTYCVLNSNRTAEFIKHFCCCCCYCGEACKD